MDINVTLKIESPEIMASILALAESLTEMKLKVKHYWEEDNNKNLGKTLDKYYEKDPCLIKREANIIVDNEGEKNNKLEAISNANSMVHLSNRGTGISENSTGEEGTEHIEAIIEENIRESLKNNVRNQLEEMQSHTVLEHIKEISKKEAKEKLDETHKGQGIELSEEIPNEKVIEDVKKIEHKEIIKEEIKNNKTITFQDIKTKLAALSKGGKHKEVKDLLNKYGFSKVTEISSQYYESIFREAERF